MLANPLARCLLGLLLVFVFVSPARSGPPPGEVQISEAQDGGEVNLAADQILTISLKSNPSTGYGWETDGLAPAALPVLQQLGPAEIEPGLAAAGLPLVGTPGRQTLRFKAVAAGQETLTLVYRRPWENDPALNNFTLRVKAAAPTLPTALPAPTPAPVLNQAADELSTLTLPAAFSWCDRGACPPVRNQGSCGSCWAFGTVGPLEANLLLRDGISHDLSEQYLVSCTVAGYGCDGGWFVHDYHRNQIPPGETAAGAVYEVDFPYKTQKVTCDYPDYPQPHPHYEKIVTWASVGGSNRPTVAQIKETIHTYGPVATTICVGTVFQRYRGGLFQTDESSACGGLVNHAVVLVGWNDDYQGVGVWRLRNSWGTGWGEGGYMNIRWNTSNVGFATNYVAYSGTGCPDAYETDNSSGVAPEITVNGPAQSRRFQVVGDEDWVKFAATAGQVYTITTANLAAGSDTRLELFDRDGTNRLKDNDNCPDGGLASCIKGWTAPASGTYYIKVSNGYAEGGCTTYDYQLAVNDSTASPPLRLYLPLVVKNR